MYWLTVSWSAFADGVAVAAGTVGLGGATVDAAPLAQSTSTRSAGTSIGVPPPPATHEA